MRDLFADRILVVRKALGLTQTALAEKVGVSRQQVARWERGDQTTSQSRLEELCNILGITPAQFWDPEWPHKDTPVIDDHNLMINDGRASKCPDCGEDRYSGQARYCPACGFPLFNFCVAEERHINKPDAKFCEICAARTLWSLTPEEWEKIEIAPDFHSTRKQRVPSETT